MSKRQRDPKDLLFSVTRKDLDIVAFRGSGNGGQNRNVRDTACRIRHRESGAVTEAQEHRTFDQNRRAAFLRLAKHPKFRIWLAEMTQIAQGMPSIGERVERAMSPQNLRVETRNLTGKWEVSDEDTSVRGRTRKH